MPDFVCLGVPYWIGERAGAVNAVADVQATGIAAELNAPWVEVVAAAAAPDAVTAVNRALAAAVVAHPGRIPLIFAGDCTACIGALAGLAAQQPAVVWYDAHGDFNTPATTLSGFLGGMPLAALVGRGNEHLLAGVGLSPLPEPDIILTDARDLDAPEADALHHSQVTHLPQVEQLLTHPLPDRPLYIHFDT
ncbi:MAG: arginase family protein, partial [Anaerolineae bacterium]|nr:arginase family protein [Anaerolineae bacterium]